MGDKGRQGETKASIVSMQELRIPHSKAVWGKKSIGAGTLLGAPGLILLVTRSYERSISGIATNGASDSNPEGSNFTRG